MTDILGDIGDDVTDRLGDIGDDVTDRLSDTLEADDKSGDKNSEESTQDRLQG